MKQNSEYQKTEIKTNKNERQTKEKNGEIKKQKH